MRILAVFVVAILAGHAFGQQRRFVTGSRLMLGTGNELSASARISDVDGDDDLDVIIGNGRHWPGQNFVFLNQGRARFNVQRALGMDRCTSYAAEPADLDGDGDVDIAVGNDMAPNRIFFNDGTGVFKAGPAFGDISSVRSVTLADIDGDGDIDALTTCRGKRNQILLNDGAGHFSAGNSFGNERDSTIDVAVADWNGDGHLDLVLANRDDQQNAILINNGTTDFATSIPFGTEKQQTRAVAVADINGDSKPDIVTANIGQPNVIYFADGNGGFAESIEFGRGDGRTYALTIADMDNDKMPDLIVGNVGQPNAVFFQRGDGKGGKRLEEVRYGADANATYSVAVGDLDNDGFADIAVANSGAPNGIFLNRVGQASRASSVEAAIDQDDAVRHRNDASRGNDASRVAEWDSFRGHGARGVANGFPVLAEWNADKEAGELSGIEWTTRVPGLGHSSPVVSGDRIFLATAIAATGSAPLKVGRGGQPTAADDDGEQSWVVLCYDRGSGEELWRRTACRGKPRATRHAKATHANSTVAVEGNNVVAFFGSEGLHCFDREGNLLWQRDLGVINISKYGIGWGYASSPVVHADRIGIVCDDPDDPFVATLRLSDGKEVWRRSRKEICERSWGTPLVHAGADTTQVVVNGWPWIVSYDWDSGDELWRIRGGGDNPVPTPFEANGWIYITNAHGAESPIFVVRPDARGDISPPEETGANDSVVWSTRRGGSYMSTPVVYKDHLYLGNTNGVLRCYDAKTGEKVYEKRLGSGASIIASLVAADGKIYCASENGIVYVVKAGSDFQILSQNRMGEPCFATPAISQGVLYVRTTESLTAIR